MAVRTDALLAPPKGGYAVELVDPGGIHRMADRHRGPIFGNADGLVAVSGSGLATSQRVVVPKV